MECSVEYSLFRIRCEVSVCIKSESVSNFLAVYCECGRVEYLEFSPDSILALLHQASAGSLSSNSFVEFGESYVSVSKTVLAVILIYGSAVNDGLDNVYEVVGPVDSG